MRNLATLRTVNRLVEARLGYKIELGKKAWYILIVVDGNEAGAEAVAKVEDEATHSQIMSYTLKVLQDYAGA
jgi:hypothetical protein